eukprot:scaffold96507_cov61-Phaeocystis_antarctica.AAC.1
MRTSSDAGLVIWMSCQVPVPGPRFGFDELDLVAVVHRAGTAAQVVPYDLPSARARAAVRLDLVAVVHRAGIAAQVFAYDLPSARARAAVRA